MHMTADTEVVREILQGSSTDSCDGQQTRGAPLGTDDTGTRYYQLAADAGLSSLLIRYVTKYTVIYQTTMPSKPMQNLQHACVQSICNCVQNSNKGISQASQVKSGHLLGRGSPTITEVLVFICCCTSSLECRERLQ